MKKVESKDAIVRTMLHDHETETTHLSYQAWSYVSMIRDCNEDVRKYRILLQVCVCLHNYHLHELDDLTPESYEYVTEKEGVLTHV